MDTKFTDTDRLNYLLKFIFVDDVGDYDCAKGVVVKYENMELELTSGPVVDGCMENLVQEWDDDLRDVIDRSMIAHGFKEDVPLFVCKNCGHEWDDENRFYCGCGGPYRVPNF